LDKVGLLYRKRYASGANTKSKASPIICLLELFCTIDDFWQSDEPLWHQTLLANGQHLQPKKPSINLNYHSAPEPAYAKLTLQ
jgi:hypothetical protein